MVAVADVVIERFVVVVVVAVVAFELRLLDFVAVGMRKVVAAQEEEGHLSAVDAVGWICDSRVWYPCLTEILIVVVVVVALVPVIAVSVVGVVMKRLHRGCECESGLLVKVKF